MANSTKGIRKIQVNGVELAYRFDGPEGGRVVMMSNSLMSDHTMWDVTVPALGRPLPRAALRHPRPRPFGHHARPLLDRDARR